MSRGYMIVHPKNLPHVERRFEAMMVWMNEAPLDPSRQYLIKQTTQTARVSIDHIDYRIDVDSLHKVSVTHLALNDIGRVALTSNHPLFHDAYQNNRLTRSFILGDYLTNNTVAAGMIIVRLPEDRVPIEVDADSEPRASTSKRSSLVHLDRRIARYCQNPCTIWITAPGGLREVVCHLQPGTCVVRGGILGRGTGQFGRSQRAQPRPGFLRGGPSGEPSARGRMRARAQRHGAHRHRLIHLAKRGGPPSGG